MAILGRSGRRGGPGPDRRSWCSPQAGVWEPGGSPARPFLLLDDFRSDYPFEIPSRIPLAPAPRDRTITYVLEGKWSTGTAWETGRHHRRRRPVDDRGSGIVHQEMPEGDAKGRMGGFQLWRNLPASDKMMDPRYRT